MAQTTTRRPYGGYCTCGWRGAGSDDAAVAQAELDAHLAGEDSIHPMAAPTVPASRVARDLLSLIPDLHDMDDAELMATENRAARAFTGASLHRNAVKWRDEVEAARDLWLAVQAEWEARR